MAEAPCLLHPGPVARDRITAVPCRATRRRLTLKAGTRLLDAVSEATGGAGAWVDLRDVATAPLSFVRPAPVSDAGHVAWYSAPTTLPRATVLHAGMHLGRRDGARFAHVHGVWADDAGRRHAGHLLADETRLAADHVVDAWVLGGARMDAAFDAETGFTLFRPVRTEPVTAPNAVLAIVRPNVSIDAAIASLVAKAGRHRAVKGLGSLVGTRLHVQAGLVDHATEVLLTDDAATRVVSVGFDGPAVAGTLAPGANRVCVTFEVLVLADPA